MGFLDHDLRVFAQCRSFQFLLQQLRRTAYPPSGFLISCAKLRNSRRGLRLVQHLFFTRQFQGPVDGMEFQQQCIWRSCMGVTVQLRCNLMPDACVLSVVHVRCGWN